MTEMMCQDMEPETLGEMFTERVRVLEQTDLYGAMAEQFEDAAQMYCFDTAGRKESTTDPRFWLRRDDLQADLAGDIQDLEELLGVGLVLTDSRETEIRPIRTAETLEDRIDEALATDRLALWLDEHGWGDRTFIVTEDQERLHVSDGDFWCRRDEVLEALMTARDAG